MWYAASVAILAEMKMEKQEFEGGLRVSLRWRMGGEHSRGLLPSCSVTRVEASCPNFPPHSPPRICLATASVAWFCLTPGSIESAIRTRQLVASLVEVFVRISMNWTVARCCWQQDLSLVDAIRSHAVFCLRGRTGMTGGLLSRLNSCRTEIFVCGR